MQNIWQDPRVIEALKERDASDIAVLDCPRCGEAGYYNEGSHFTCLKCDQTFYCCSEGETPPESSHLFIDESVRQLSDCIYWDHEEQP